MCIRDRFCKRIEDLITNIIIARMPTSHIPNSMYPMLDGVSLFTERAKSFIQSAFPAGLIPTASPMAVLVPEVGELFRLLSHERICGNPIKRNGIKGTTNNPSSRNHRLYCIRLDRLPLNIRLAIKRIPMIPLINTSVSYTHLDVYKRQVFVTIYNSLFRLNLVNHSF